MAIRKEVNVVTIQNVEVVVNGYQLYDLNRCIVDLYGKVCDF
jgi:hypothetical protein